MKENITGLSLYHERPMRRTDDELIYIFINHQEIHFAPIKREPRLLITGI